MQNNDYISREAVFEWYCNSVDEDGCVDMPKNNGYCRKGCRCCAEGQEIDDIPAADVRPVVRWIPVEERLPEACETVLVYRVVSGVYVQIKEICFAHTLKIYDKVTWSEVGVTHWMPLPEAPEIGDLQ